MQVPNQVFRKFLTDHGAVLKEKNHLNKWHLFKSNQGAVLKIPNTEEVDVIYLYIHAETHLDISNLQIDYWLGQNGVTA